MKVTGTRTVVENLKVDVKLSEIFSEIYDKFVPNGLSHLTVENGKWFWYKEDGFDYHKREDLYKRVREATPEEVEFIKAYSIIKNFALSVDSV